MAWALLSPAVTGVGDHPYRAGLRKGNGVSLQAAALFPPALASVRAVGLGGAVIGSGWAGVPVLVAGLSLTVLGNGRLISLRRDRGDQ